MERYFIPRRRLRKIAAGLLILTGCLQATGQQKEILVFTAANAYVHQVTGTALDALEILARKHHFRLTHAADSTRFHPDTLARFDGVIFLNNSGDILDTPQEEALREFVEGGGGFTGIHGASTCEKEWDWYGRLIGRWFTAHPKIQTAVMDVADRDHPSTWHLPERWIWTDEWYEFTPAQSDSLHVLLTVDESTYNPVFTSNGIRYTGMQPEHPVAWCREMGKGRMFYTALGHLEAAWNDARFLQHVYGGLWWTLQE